MKILIIMAMREEAWPSIKGLSLKSKGLLNPIFDFELFEGTYQNASIFLVLNGKCKEFAIDHIGPQISTLSAHLGIEAIDPDIVINAGTAGGFKTDNAKISDVYLSYPYVCYHDRRINLPGFKEYGIGRYQCITSKTIANDLGLRTGVISTGSSLDYTQKDLEVIKSYNGVVKDMEAAAIAWVAQIHSKPFLAIKAITDIVDGDKPTEEEFLQNLKSASVTLSEKMDKVVEWIVLNGIDA